MNFVFWKYVYENPVNSANKMVFILHKAGQTLMMTSRALKFKLKTQNYNKLAFLRERQLILHTG